MKIKGIIFDMDGVVTQTADLHCKAWKVVFNQFFRQIKEKDYYFTLKDYLYYFDGIPRIDGVINFLNACKIDGNKITNKYGSLKKAVEEICKIKNNLFLSMIDENKVKVFPDALEFIKYLLALNYKVAIISSSKNCQIILDKAGIIHLFSICIDGESAERKNIPGKPHPGIFLEAAKQLQLLPEQCMVIEDALAGVSAAKQGQFGLVVALDRKNKLFNEFKQYDPDYILRDLSKNQVNLYKTFDSSKAAPAINALPILSSALIQQKEIVVFLDYDGTLTPIVDRPQDAHLSSVMKESILQLCKNYLTIIISGRELSNLKEKVGVETLFYAGNHGFEFESPKNFNFSYEIGKEYIEDIQSIFKKIYSILKDVKGCIIENKKFTLSIHYRLVHETNYELISSTIDFLLPSYPKLSRHAGKKVIEIRPNIPWNKGIFSINLLKNMKKDNPNVIPIYIGDDLTDEDAFQLFNANGITIKVGQGSSTHAHYFLESPNEVRLFLDQLTRFKEKNE